MYQLDFLETKNKEQTVKVNGILLHSMYSPTNEAIKFVQNINISFNFNKIFILEPGIGYCLPYLKERFPEKEIIVIKIVKDIPLKYSEYKTINFFNYKSTDEFENYFYNNFTEVEILSSLFITWHASEKIFLNENNKIFNSIKKILDRSKSVLITRGYFETKWLKNACNNLKYITKTVEIKSKTDLPILIVASGPSLENMIPHIKNNKENFFIICVSSAIKPLLYNKITPDLFISTDGGYWAGKHLDMIEKNDFNVPFAIPMEAYCTKKILSNSTILPLTYEDGLSYELEKNTFINFYKAERNGTVSGTALKLALNLTTNNIYLCGLDLHNSKGFQHLKPNSIENTKYIISNKVNSLQKILTASEFNSGSLKTYENWFQMQKNIRKNIFRIIDNPQNNLNNIKDISISEFENLLNKIKPLNSNKNIFSDRKQIFSSEKKFYLNNIKAYINANYKTDEWFENIFPLDYISYLHSSNDVEKIKILEKINNKNRKMIDNLNNLLNISDQ